MDEEKRDSDNLDPELLGLVRDKLHDGWSEGKIREWLVKHGYTKGQAVKALSVVSDEERPEKERRLREDKRKKLLWKEENVFFYLLAALIVLVFIFLSPIPGNIVNTIFAPHPGSCFYLESRYCGLGLQTKGADNSSYTAYNLPQGTYIFSPFAGLYTYEALDYSVSSTDVYTLGTVEASTSNGTSTFEFYSVFRPMVASSSIVTQGQPIAVIQGPAVDPVLNANLMIRE